MYYHSNHSSSDSDSDHYHLKQQYNETLDEAIDLLRQKNYSSVSSSLITKINNTNSYYNSINIAVGRQRSGKTHTLIREIIKISQLSPNTHMLIYCNKTGNTTDATFESMKALIKIPIKYVKHNDLPEFLQEFLMWKQLYNEIINNNLDVIDSQRDELFDKMMIQDFSRPFLHTLILLDDVAQAKILKNEKTYIQELMTQCAHIHCSFFLAVQFWKSLTTNIKENASVVYLFGGFSKRQLVYILSQIGVPTDYNELWIRYSRLPKHDKIIIDINQ
jgi:hypothetical protein